MNNSVERSDGQSSFQKEDKSHQQSASKVSSYKAEKEEPTLNLVNLKEQSS